MHFTFPDGNAVRINCHDSAALLAAARQRLEQGRGFAIATINVDHLQRLGEDAGFRRAYAILATQRATRLLGQFPRLKHRDGKPGYLRHVPRLWAYLERTIEDPVTRPLKLWYDAVIPSSKRR